MIVVTGAAGFIGSNIISQLNQDGYKDIVAVDKFDQQDKNLNLKGKNISEKIDRDVFFEWAEKNQAEIEFIFHIGARSDTTEKSKEVFDRLNYHYSQKVWNLCVNYGIPMVYASSAATYGLGELGYEDSHDIVPRLKPLNLYGESKNNFDIWALQQERAPYFWAGLKFFNVYGPNEYHKGRMASVILHAFKQINQNGKMNLFKSHHPDYADGGQLRDFVYVKDLVSAMLFLMKHRKDSGIYNLGTGKARSFYDLVSSTFNALNKPIEINFIDTPLDIRDKYQYFTEAKMDKLRSIGYTKAFYTLEEGVTDYVTNYLIPNKYF